jgi:hypothetical protein
MGSFVDTPDQDAAVLYINLIEDPTGGATGFLD